MTSVRRPKARRRAVRAAIPAAGRVVAVRRGGAEPATSARRGLGVEDDSAVGARLRPARRHRGAPRAAVGHDRRVGRHRLARRDRRAVGRESLPRAPAVQGHARPLGARDRGGGRVGRRRDERVHRPGGDGLLRPRPRRAPRPRGRDPERRAVASRVPARRGRLGTSGDPRRDRDARRHARRSRARPVRGRAVPRAPARSLGARHRLEHRGDAARRHRGVPRGALPARQHRHRGRRQPHARRSRRAAGAARRRSSTATARSARPTASPSRSRSR